MMHLVHEEIFHSEYFVIFHNFFSSKFKSMQVFTKFDTIDS